MRQNFTYPFSKILIIALAVSLNYAFASGPRHAAKRDTIKYFLGSKPVKKKSPLSFLSLPPFKAGVTSTVKANVAPQSDKLLSNVEVFPNPVTDQINLKYMVSRNSTVTIKLMDVLGNNVATLSSQRVEPGEQTPSYSTKNYKIARGFYFISVVAGTESVYKRVSIL